MQTLFNAVQRACSSHTWSRGVELSRADSVTGERSSHQEVVLRVMTRRGMVAPIVTLYPEDEDWECTCRSNDEACEHVAAAVIALRQARKAGQALPEPKQRDGKIRYRFAITKSDELEFEREIVDGDTLHPLTTTLEALSSGRVRGPRFSLLPQDVAVEHALGSRRRGVLPAESMAKLFEALAGSAEVLLGDEAIAVSAEPVLPLGRVVDAPGGVRIYVEQDPSISRVFANGVVACGDTLRPVGLNRLTGREMSELPRGRFFPDEQLAELVTEVLPSLKKRIRVEIATERLPDTSSEDTPRILLDVRRDGDKLSVLPTLVYGSPPSARIDAGRLVHIQGAIPIRDEPEERAQIRLLQQQLQLTPGHRESYAAEEAISFADRLARWRGEVKGDAHRQFERLPELIPQLEVEDDTLQLHFALPPDAETTTRGDHSSGEHASRVAAESVLSAWSEGASMVSVGGAGFAPLPQDWLSRFGQRVADLLAARQEDGVLPTCSLPDLGRLCEDLDRAPPPRLERLRPILEDFRGIARVAPPADLRAELRGYQQEGIDWLCFLRDAQLGALLADDMGLGKTLQALCALRGRSLVVVPTSLLHNWADEMERFRPGITYSVYHGPKRQLDPDVEVVLTSYALLRLDADQLCAERWDNVVLDEAQNIKNPESQVAQAVYRLRADFRMALTGTPVENRLDELWSQIHFLNPGLLGGRKDFQNRYARPIGEGDSTAAARLRERIRPFVLRRLKKDVAPELPPRTEVVLHCELDESERQVYDAVRAASVAKVVERLRSGGNVMAALEALLRLRQAACHSGLVPGQIADHSTKVALLIDRIEQAVADGHKALVFSQWTSFLDLVEPHLHAAAVTFERLDGATRDRKGVVERFQDEAGAPVMLVSLRAGGTGLNLTAADHIFLLDPWWNPAVEDQAADRAHRIGQTRPVVVHRIVALDTVEERILEMHARKRALSDVALAATDAGVGLSREDLLTLLEV